MNALNDDLSAAIVDLLGHETGQPACEVIGGRVRDRVEFSGYLFYKYADSEPGTAAIAPEAVDSAEALRRAARGGAVA